MGIDALRARRNARSLGSVHSAAHIPDCVECEELCFIDGACVTEELEACPQHPAQSVLSR